MFPVQARPFLPQGVSPCEGVLSQPLTAFLQTALLTACPWSLAAHLPALCAHKPNPRPCRPAASHPTGRSQRPGLYVETLAYSVLPWPCSHLLLSWPLPPLFAERWPTVHLPAGSPHVWSCPLACRFHLALAFSCRHLHSAPLPSHRPSPSSRPPRCPSLHPALLGPSASRAEVPAFLPQGLCSVPLQRLLPGH